MKRTRGQAESARMLVLAALLLAGLGCGGSGGGSDDGGDGAGNLAPTAAFTATPDAGPAPLTVALDAAGSSDPDGSIVAYAWAFGDGETGNGVTTQHTYDQVGNYTVTLTVVDDGGATNTTQHLIAVSGQPVACPLFTATPGSGTAPLTVTFDASGAPASLSGYVWEFGDGDVLTGQMVEHTYTDGGTYTAGLYVQLADGSFETCSVEIDVTANQAPIASFEATPDAGAAPLAVVFDAAGSVDPDGGVASYTWIFGDGETGSGVTTSHTYTLAGNYTVTLTVTDDAGNQDQATAGITVTAAAEPVAAFFADPPAGITPLVVAFDASASTDDVGIVAYAWAFGDGETGSGVTTSHTYTVDGTYTVTLTVTDDDSNSVSTSHTVVVSSTGTRIGPAGGSVTSADGRAILEIPAGALAVEVGIAIAPAIGYPAGAVANTVYAVEPDGLTFAVPATLTLAYDSADLPAATAEAALWLGKVVGATALNWQTVPGYTVSAADDTVSAPLLGLSTYGIGAGNSLDEPAQEVYVVDNPAAGSSSEFYALGDALDHLNQTLAPSESGAIVIRTDRALAVDSLTFSRNISIRLDDGYTGTIAGPGATPLLVNAPGSLGLTGLSIVNAGGLVVDAGANLVLTGNTLPATTVNLEGAGAGRAARGARGSAPLAGNQWTFNDNIAAGPFQLIANGDLAGDLNIANNRALTLNWQGSGTLLGTATLSGNITDEVGVQFKVGLGASLTAKDHAGLDLSTFDLDMADGSFLTLDGMISTEARVNLLGSGKSVTVAFNANSFQKADWSFGVAELNLNGEGGEIGEFAVQVAERLRWTQNGLTVTGPWTLTMAEDSGTRLDLFLNGSVSVNGVFNVHAGGKFYWQIQEDLTLATYAEVVAVGEVLDIRGSGLQAELGLSIDAGAVSISSFVSFSNQASGNRFGGPLSYSAPNGAETQFAVQGAAFTAGAALEYKNDWLSGPGAPRVAAAGGGSITIQDVTMAEGSAGIMISGVDSPITAPITIEDCTINSDGGIGIHNANGAVTIRQITLTGGGMLLTQVTGSVSIQEATIDGTTAYGGIYALMSDHVSVQGGSISAQEPGHAVYAMVSEVEVANAQLNGQLSALPEGRLRLTDNTFSGGQVGDANQDGGLLNDPVADNDGLGPGDVTSLIDFDDNGCADYCGDPAQYCNQRDPETGECGMDGIPPPG